MNRLTFEKENNYSECTEEQKREMQKNILDFLDSIEIEKKILIFGAGNVARRLCKEFERNELSEKIDAFIVSKKEENVSELNGISVKNYTDFKYAPEKIIIAVWETKQNEIYSELVKNEINKDRIIKLPFSVNKALELLYRENKKWKGSGKYWEERYKNGGNSGAGSYNRLAEFKAETINKFVREHGITSVVEWGCGDGNQLSLADYPEYTGYDVSEKAIEICCKKYGNDLTKKFIWCGKESFENEMKADLSLSLDVIYHLVEDDIFQIYMDRLFNSSLKYVCIYSCDFEKKWTEHVRCRKFTDYVERYYKGWKLTEHYPNKYPYRKEDPDHTSWSEFFFYEKVML